MIFLRSLSWANELMERLDITASSYQEYLEWTSQREAGYFKLTAVPVKFFDLDFGL